MRLGDEVVIPGDFCLSRDIAEVNTLLGKLMGEIPEEQLEIINKMVFKSDTFVCLSNVGDPKYVPMIKARKKVLILGNHDARGAYKDRFDEIDSGPLFISDKILLSHEPVYGLLWCLNIHGHDHNGMEAYHEGV